MNGHLPIKLILQTLHKSIVIISNSSTTDEIILWFNEDNFLFAADALLGDLRVVFFAASRTRELRLPQENIDAAITRAVRTLGRKLYWSVARVKITSHRHYRCSTVTTGRREPNTHNLFSMLQVTIWNQIEKHLRKTLKGVFSKITGIVIHIHVIN